jgi:hypothetical protein
MASLTQLWSDARSTTVMVLVLDAEAEATFKAIPGAKLVRM